MNSNNESLVSIIVPLHNDEKNIVYCLESLLQQTYKNIEIIIIENASTDNGYFICKEFAKKDKRIKLFSTEKAGVSYARNLGIEESIGKYIFFCDSDDYMEKNMIERMVYVLKNSNSCIAVCGYKKTNEHKGNNNYYKPMSTIEIWDRISLAKYMFIDNSIRGAVWNKGFTRDIIGKIRFDETLSYCEDFHFIMQILSEKKKCKIGYINEKLYYYYTNSNSATQNRIRTIDIDGNSKYVMAFNKMLELDFPNEIQNLIYASIFRDTVSALLFVDKDLLKNEKNCLYKDKKKYLRKYFYNKQICIKNKIIMSIKLIIIRIGIR